MTVAESFFKVGDLRLGIIPRFLMNLAAGDVETKAEEYTSNGPQTVPLAMIKGLTLQNNASCASALY